MKKIVDIYGEVNIDESKNWGASTQRSLENFPIGVEKMPIDLIEALIKLKKACALANRDCNQLDEQRAHAIVDACDDLLAGSFMEEFPLSVWQTGSGTQTNMNANEVIANLANKALGESLVHPNDHVNMGQSSNDIFPSAMHIMAVTIINERLLPALENVSDTFDILSQRHADVIKVGRTHLQDATPITVGQEISAWAFSIETGIKNIAHNISELEVLAIGGTAVGTGLNTVEGFDELVCHYLNVEFKYNFRPSQNKFHALSSKDAYALMSGVLNSIAADVLKIVNDIRWLASGPRCGFGELNIPANEAGSSIMPGKVNPTQCEAMSMVAVQVMANHQAITIGASQGNFQLNVYMPLLTYNFWQSTILLAEGLNSLNDRCLKGITINVDKIKQFSDQNLMAATLLNKKIGYDLTSRIVNKAHLQNKSLKEVIVEEDVMTAEAFDDYMDYQEMIKPKSRG